MPTSLRRRCENDLFSKGFLGMKKEIVLDAFREAKGRRDLINISNLFLLFDISLVEKLYTNL